MRAHVRVAINVRTIHTCTFIVYIYSIHEIVEWAHYSLNMSSTILSEANACARAILPLPSKCQSEFVRVPREVCVCIVAIILI